MGFRVKRNNRGTEETREGVAPLAASFPKSPQKIPKVKESR
jgi:hypothetical protein